MHRLIVTSHTYRQSSADRPDLREKDPHNYLLARQQRLRLDAEIVRDVALAASGLLSPKLGGPPVYPPIPDGVMGQGQVKRSLDGEQRRGQVPPRPLHLRLSRHAAALAERLRCARRLQHLHAPHPQQHAAAGAHAAERQRLFRVRHRAGEDHPTRTASKPPSAAARRGRRSADELAVLEKLDTLTAARALLEPRRNRDPRMNAMNPDHSLRDMTRRHFFSRCSDRARLHRARLADGGARTGRAALRRCTIRWSRSRRIFPPKAKNVIFLFMAGGPSQLELFDHKPKLTELNGQPIPESYTEGKRFAFMDSSHRREPARPRSVSSSSTARAARGSAICCRTPPASSTTSASSSTCKTDLFNHAPAKLFMNTGSGLFGRPSMGSWVTYGLGSECDDLPGFVVLQSGPRGPRGGAVLWGSGMLPTTYQGVPLRNQGDPIVNLSTPHAVSAAQQRQLVDAVRELNLKRLVETGDDEIATRINAYEMAYRMQTSAPELMDIRGETPGHARPLRHQGRQGDQPSPATACSRGGWSSAACASCSSTTPTGTTTAAPPRTWRSISPKNAADIDQPCAALVRDLKQRGLLDDTIVIWGGEFGRTPMGEVRESTGRNHHIDAFTMWFAGGGFKAGPGLWPDRRVRLRRRGEPRPRPRHPRHAPASARPRSRAAHRPLPRPRLPPHRREACERGEGVAGLKADCSPSLNGTTVNRGVTTQDLLRRLCEVSP